MADFTPFYPYSLDLTKNLRQISLGNVGLDVCLNEPRPDVRLTDLQNVILSPHHASGTVETRDAMAMLVVQNLAAHFAGEELLTRVDVA